MERQLTQTIYLMGLDMHPRPCNNGLCSETMRHNTPTTMVEEIKGRGRGKRMAFKALETSTLPVVQLRATEPRLTVRETGQATVSTAAAKTLEGCNYVRVFKDKNMLAFLPVKDKPAEGLAIHRGKKGKNVSLSLGSILKRDYPEYKYAKAGTQPFDAKEVTHKSLGRLLVVHLPTETPKYRAPVKRKPRTKPTPETVESTGGDDTIDLE